MGLGLLAWTGGELYWTLVLSYDDPVPVPVGRRRPLPGLLPRQLRGAGAAGPRAHESLPLEPVAGRSHRGLAVAAFAAALAFQPIVDATVGDPVTVAVNLAYPVGDLVLLSLVVASFGALGLAARTAAGCCWASAWR